MDEDIQLIDIEASIKNKVLTYFGSVGPRPCVIASDIALGAVVLGADSVTITRNNDWWLISSPSDWFSLPNRAAATPTNVFEATWALPELGQNCYRSEIMAKVFGNTVITSSSSGIQLIKGVKSDLESFASASNILSEAKRILGFRFPIAPN